MDVERYPRKERDLNEQLEMQLYVGYEGVYSDCDEMG